MSTTRPVSSPGSPDAIDAEADVVFTDISHEQEGSVASQTAEAKQAGTVRPQQRPAAKRRAVSKASAVVSTTDMALNTNAPEANGHASMAHADMAGVDMAIKIIADADVAETDMAEADVANGDRAPATDAAPSSAEKPKRKYVKSGKYVGKYNSWKQKQDQGQNGTAETPADGDTPSKRKRGRPAGKQKVNSTVQDPQTAADPKDGQAAQPNNLVGAERNQPTGHKKRGRPRGSVNKKKTVAAEAHLAAEVEADRAAAAANGQEAKVDVEVAEADVVGSHARLPKLNDKDETEAGVARDVVTDAVAGPSTDSMADGVADSRAQDRLESSEARAEGKLASSGALAEGMLESPDVMARKASTGDGSRLVRPTRDTECDTVDSLLEAPGAGQSALSPNGQHRGQQQGEQAEESSEPAQNGVGQGEQGNPGAPKPNAAGLDTADRPRHRLSRVTGREESCTDGNRELTPVGENDGPLHRNDSTFGEYMASLQRRSSSSLNRKLSGPGKTERLLEMLHGSDGWGKLVSELQQKEEDETEVQQQEVHEGQKAVGRKRRRDGDAPTDARHNKVEQAGSASTEVGAVEQATSGATTDDSRASRPKRARARFDYSILNGTSGNIGAFIQEPDPPKPMAKKRKQSKLDEAGNKPEVSVYAKAYNKVKAQFVRIRMEETLLNAYGADGHRGSGQERIKLQSEMDRAHKQVEKCQTVIRECVKFCEDAEGDKAIPSECYDTDGELPERHIFCAKCHTGDSQEDNDIVLCDGDCGRAYHEQCLQPRIHVNELPEEEGWLCHACDAKADIILAINEEFNAEYEEAAPWHSLFAEAPQRQGTIGAGEEGPGLSDGPVSFLNMDLGDSDPDDSSFGSKDMSDDEVAQPNKGKEEEETAGQSSDSEADSQASSARSSGSASSSDAGSDSELADLSEEEQEAIAGLVDDKVDLEAPRSKRVRTLRSAHESSSQPQLSGTSGMTPSETTSDMVTGKRRRQQIDYKALNDSMFGNTECYEGEGLEEADDEYAPTHKKHKEDSDPD